MRFALQVTARLLVGLLLATMGSGCATRMQTNLDQETDFSRYRTWGWQTRELSPRPARPSALDLQVARRMQSALLDRGLYYVDEDPDLLVFARLVITREQVTEHTTPAVQGLSSLHDGGYYEIQVTETVVRYYERGRLAVEVIDARQHREIWRGEIEGRYQEAFRPHLDEVVVRLVGRFPMCVEPSMGTHPSAIARTGDAAAGLSARPGR
jgi:hypothetical protein